MQKLKNFLNSVSTEVFNELLEVVNPKNEIMGKTIPDVTVWKFCDVMDLMEAKLLDATIKLVNTFANDSETPITEEDLLELDAKEFMGFAKHLKDEFKKVEILMQQLEREPDQDMIDAGMHNMNKFGVLAIYYAISKDPTTWDKISEAPFGRMYTKLLMDKETAEIQDKYQKAMMRKQKQKQR